jgi:hypothetical protein
VSGDLMWQVVGEILGTKLSRRRREEPRCWCQRKILSWPNTSPSNSCSSVRKQVALFRPHPPRFRWVSFTFEMTIASLQKILSIVTDFRSKANRRRWWHGLRWQTGNCQATRRRFRVTTAGRSSGRGSCSSCMTLRGETRGETSGARCTARLGA